MISGKEVIVYTCTHGRQVTNTDGEWRHTKHGGRVSILTPCKGAILRSRVEIKPEQTQVIREEVNDG